MQRAVSCVIEDTQDAADSARAYWERTPLEGRLALRSSIAALSSIAVSQAHFSSVWGSTIWCAGTSAAVMCDGVFCTSILGQSIRTSGSANLSSAKAQIGLYSCTNGCWVVETLGYGCPDGAGDAGWEAGGPAPVVGGGGSGCGAPTDTGSTGGGVYASSRTSNATSCDPPLPWCDPKLPGCIQPLRTTDIADLDSALKFLRGPSNFSDPRARDACAQLAAALQAMLHATPPQIFLGSSLLPDGGPMSHNGATYQDTIHVDQDMFDRIHSDQIGNADTFRKLLLQTKIGRAHV